jgi:protein-L-isoaspartate O-methyltransferase
MKFEVKILNKDGKEIVSEVREASHKAHAIVQAIYNIPREPYLTDEITLLKIEAREIK